MPTGACFKLEVFVLELVFIFFNTFFLLVFVAFFLAEAVVSALARITFFVDFAVCCVADVTASTFCVVFFVLCACAVAVAVSIVAARATVRIACCFIFFTLKI